MRQSEWIVIIIVLIIGILLFGPVHIRGKTLKVIGNIASIFYNRDSSVESAEKTGESFHKKRLRNFKAPKKDVEHWR